MKAEAADVEVNGEVAAVEAKFNEVEERFGDRTYGDSSGESGAEAGAVAGGDENTASSWESTTVGLLGVRDGPAITGGAGDTTGAAATQSMASRDSSSMGEHKSCSFADVTGDGGDGGGMAGWADVPSR